MRIVIQWPNKNQRLRTVKVCFHSTFGCVIDPGDLLRTAFVHERRAENAFFPFFRGFLKGQCLPIDVLDIRRGKLPQVDRPRLTGHKVKRISGDHTFLQPLRSKGDLRFGYEFVIHTQSLIIHSARRSGKAAVVHLAAFVRKRTRYGANVHSTAIDHFPCKMAVKHIVVLLNDNLGGHRVGFRTNIRYTAFVHIIFSLKEGQGVAGRIVTPAFSIIHRAVLPQCIAQVRFTVFNAQSHHAGR